MLAARNKVEEILDLLSSGRDFLFINTCGYLLAKSAR